MKKIIVPVDFSVASSWGYYYAYDMAKSLNTELVVLYLYWPPYMESTYPQAQVDAIYKAKEEDVLKHLKAATQPPLSDRANPVPCSYIVRPGSEHTIVSVAKELESELIIMGTHGADKAMDKVWGTNTGKVIQNAHCPVLAIPEGAKFNAIKRIAYATDFSEKNNERLFQLTVVATAINATVHCVHINKTDKPYDEASEQAFAERFEGDFKGLPVTFSVFSATSVNEGLQVFCRVNEIDLLAMLTHQRSLWDKLFGGQSITNSMTGTERLPLLAFHE
ncbi:MAG: universal stress protein [Aureispira sp.]